jgi:predicted O-methyltransferase YrrM
VLGLVERANYTLTRTDILEEERRAAEANLRRLQASGLLQPPRPDGRPERKGGAVRLLEKVTREADFAGDPTIDKEWIEKLLASDNFAAIETQFRDYPSDSFVSGTHRAFLFCLIRAMKPQAVAEIGTAFGGTAELIARALWENGAGLLYTTDPFGAGRAPPIIRKWPEPLQDITRFYPLSSMDFFIVLSKEKTSLDIAFIDGDHDFEFAYFDVLMAGRLLRPGGIMVIDNSSQTGPYYAAAQFLRDNPDWIELGDALAGSRLSHPFSAPRSSLAKSDCLVLKAPEAYSVGQLPRTTGQLAADSRTEGFSSNIETREFRGLLHYQVTLRAFRSGNREIEEYKSAGKIALDSSMTGRMLTHQLDEPLVSRLNERHGDCSHTLEIELAWEGAGAQRTLHLSAAPQPLAGDADQPERP